MSERAVLITGSNLGDRRGYLDEARRLLETEAGPVVAASGIHESEPWGEMGDSAGAFLNQVLVIDTALGPFELLDVTQSIEHRLGRVDKSADLSDHPASARTYRSRTIDIDILYYGKLTLDTPRLTIPHPLIAEREFVLMPLAEVEAALFGERPAAAMFTP